MANNMKFTFCIGIKHYSAKSDVIIFTYELQEKCDVFLRSLKDVIDKYYTDRHFFNRIRIIEEDVKHPFYIRVENCDFIKKMFVELLRLLRRDILLYFDIKYVAYVEVIRKSDDGRYYTHILIE